MFEINSENSSSEKKVDSQSSLNSNKKNVQILNCSKLKLNSGRKRSKTSNEFESLNSTKKVLNLLDFKNKNTYSKTFNIDTDIEKFGVFQNQNQENTDCPNSRSNRN